MGGAAVLSTLQDVLRDAGRAVIQPAAAPCGGGPSLTHPGEEQLGGRPPRRRRPGQPDGASQTGMERLWCWPATWP
jgi:hypothetical protein